MYVLGPRSFYSKTNVKIGGFLVGKDEQLSEMSFGSISNVSKNTYLIHFLTWICFCPKSFILKSNVKMGEFLVGNDEQLKMYDPITFGFIHQNGVLAIWVSDESSYLSHYCSRFDCKRC